MYKLATAIGIDIGRTMVRSAIVRLDGELIESYEFQYDSHPTGEELLKIVIEAVRSTRKESINLKVNPLCTGISAKGYINRLDGVILGPDQGIEGWNNVPLGQIIRKETGLPAFVDNDANMMAIAETTFGAAAGYDNIVFVTLRSGIGGAIIIDGKLYRGLDNAAGEFGQMSINCEGPESSKGIRGSLEHLASSGALVQSYLRLSGLNRKGSVLEPVDFSAKDVFELYYKGDARATEAVKDNARYIGTGLANINAIFSPDIIILGGGMAQAGGDYLDMIRNRVRTSSILIGNKELKVERASLGDSSSTMGAAFYALTRFDGKEI